MRARETNEFKVNITSEGQLPSEATPSQNGGEPSLNLNLNTSLPSKRGYTMAEAKKIQDSLPNEMLRVEREEKLDMALAELGFSVRVLNVFEGEGIFFVRDLLDLTKEKLLSFPNFGARGLSETYKRLQSIGFYRKGSN